MEYRVLGPLAVLRDGVELALGSRQQRMVLALLLVADGRAIADDVLTDVLWGDAPPASAHNNLQALVSRLRRALGADAIERRGEAYALARGDATLDAEVFAARVGEGRRLLAAGDAGAAERTLTDALALFRGDPYSDFRYDDFAAGEIARLEQLRLAAAEDRLAALLELGDDRNVVPEAEALVAAHPYHERFRSQLVLALYRTGRQADALAAHRHARRALLEDLGVEPSREFRDLERRILQQDPSLLAAPSVRKEQRRRLRPVVPVALAAAAAVVVALVVATTDDSKRTTVRSSSLVALDVQSGNVLSSRRLPFTPRAVAVSRDAVWVGGLRTNAVVRIDPRSGAVVQSVGLPGASALGLVADEGGVWVASAVGRTSFSLDRIEPGHDAPTRTIRWDSRTFFSVGERTAALAQGGGALWASNGESAVDALDPVTGRLRAHVVPDDGCGPIAWGGGSLWCVFTLSDTLSRIHQGRVAWTVPLAQAVQPLAKVGTARRGDVDPSAVAHGFGSLWITAYGLDSVIRVDPVRRAVLATIPVGDGPNAVATGGGAVWVANRLGRSVMRIDPELNGVTATTVLGFRAESLAAANDRVWVVVQGR